MADILVDSNVILDVVTEDPKWYEWSAGQLERLAERHTRVIHPFIYSKISVGFDRIEDLEVYGGLPVRRVVPFATNYCFDSVLRSHVEVLQPRFAFAPALTENDSCSPRQECKMTDTSATTNGKRSIWLRGLLMILMVPAFQISGTLLALGAIIQFVLALLSDTPNARLIAFGQSLGLYLSQIAAFVSFASEEAPFPFSPWPSGR